MELEIQAYNKHRNLKLAAAELGMAWQTLYVHLKKAGVAVVGDKLRYGSSKDRLAAAAEQYFRRLVPVAVDNNHTKFQAKFDFVVNGFKIDVKAARPTRGSHLSSRLRWSFSFKRQRNVCDFFVCFCLDVDGNVAKCLLIPVELCEGMQTMSVSTEGSSKWLDYQVDPGELASFFAELPSTKDLTN